MLETFTVWLDEFSPRHLQAPLAGINMSDAHCIRDLPTVKHKFLQNWQVGTGAANSTSSNDGRGPLLTRSIGKRRYAQTISSRAR